MANTKPLYDLIVAGIARVLEHFMPEAKDEAESGNGDTEPGP